MPVVIPDDARAEFDAWDSTRSATVASAGVKFIKGRKTRPPCACGGKYFASGKCRACYFRDYNRARPERRGKPKPKRGEAAAVLEKPRGHRSQKPYWRAQGLCENRWCRRQLPTALVAGVLEFRDCEYCGRLERGLCYACGKPLGERDRWSNGSPSRWHMDPRKDCYARGKATRKAAAAAWREAHHEQVIARERARNLPRYAGERKDRLRFDHRRRVARNGGKLLTPADRRAPPVKTKPCACGATIEYTTGHPKRCAACDARLYAEKHPSGVKRQQRRKERPCANGCGRPFVYFHLVKGAAMICDACLAEQKPPLYQRRSRPCPNGCGNLIYYTTRPARQCDACWAAIATTATTSPRGTTDATTSPARGRAAAGEHRAADERAIA